MATAVQLSFSLRTSTNVKTVHLLGSWDNYKNQLPLSKDAAASKPGSWKGTFRFQGNTLKLGQRYWYYYIVDGYHVSHDPAKEYTTEPTTGRKLNILDVPGGKPNGSAQRNAQQLAQGRALSPGKIQHPKPTKAYASRQIREADYAADPEAFDELTDRLESTHLRGYRDPSPSSDSSFSSSPSSSDCSDSRSSPSSLSSVSDRSCRCERYGITRSGNRVKLDCGGSRCGYTSSEASSSCSSSSSDSDSDDARTAAAAAKKRQSAYVASAKTASTKGSRGRR